jgi:murein DD-endopeptidase MepM/ murein hydrolase activator NlpD
VADSLLEESKKHQKYFTNLQMILNGQNPDVSSADTLQQKETQSDSPDSLNNDRSMLDSALRDKVVNLDRYGISLGVDRDVVAKGALMFPPVNGPISSTFNPKEGHYGIDIVAPEDDPVKAVLDGTVIVAVFTSEDGNIIQIQHANNIVSVYKHNSALLRRQGDQVRAGESIAFIGDSGDHSEGPHLHFEIWESGVPVNPADYISFGQ